MGNPVPSRNLSATVAMVHGMRAYLKAIGVDANVTACGWKERPQQINQGPGGANRIVLYPGRKPGGETAAAGELTRENRPSTTNPRALITWRKLMTMSIWAADTSNLQDEELQIAAVEQLLEWAIQAAHYAVDPATQVAVGVANLEWGSLEYTIPPVNMRFGQEIMLEFTQKCPLFDQTIGIAFPKPGIIRGTKPITAPIPEE